MIHLLSFFSDLLLVREGPVLRHPYSHQMFIIPKHFFFHLAFKFSLLQKL